MYIHFPMNNHVLHLHKIQPYSVWGPIIGEDRVRDRACPEVLVSCRWSMSTVIRARRTGPTSSLGTGTGSNPRRAVRVSIIYDRGILKSKTEEAWAWLVIALRTGLLIVLSG